MNCLFGDPTTEKEMPFAGENMRVSCLYPQKEETAFRMEGDVVTVTFEKPVMARLFVIERGDASC